MDLKQKWNAVILALPVIILAIGVLIWNGLRRHDQENIHYEFEVLSNSLAKSIDSTLEQRQLALERMGETWRMNS